MLTVGFLMDDYIEPPLKWQVFSLHEASGSTGFNSSYIKDFMEIL